MSSAALNIPGQADAGAAAQDYAGLEARILAAMTPGSALNDTGFAELALAIYHFQIRWNGPYARYAQSVNPVPRTWREIPAAPQQAFKRFDLRTFSAADTARTFRTSGTTGEARGSHHFRSLRLYETSIVEGWRCYGLPTGLSQWVLTRSPEAAPDSSLSYMMGVLDGMSAPGMHAFCLDAAGNLMLPRLLAGLQAATAQDQPVLLLGTALAFLHLFTRLESTGQRLVLPAGSQALETGGYKGTDLTLTKAELYARFEESLGLPAAAVINEYGMTELSSAFYTRGLGSPHEGPPWTRALVADPETGAEVRIGETGLLRIFDLANLGSVLAVQTQDLAVRRAAGAFELLGRDPAALPRGCSRSADEMLAGATSAPI